MLQSHCHGGRPDRHEPPGERLVGESRREAGLDVVAERRERHRGRPHSLDATVVERTNAQVDVEQADPESTRTGTEAAARLDEGSRRAVATGDRYVEALCRSGRAMLMTGHEVDADGARAVELYGQLGVQGSPPGLSRLAV